MNKIRRDIHSSDVPEVCISCEARHGGICGALGPTELLRMSDFTSVHTLEAGTDIISQGEAPEICSIILSGVVKTSKLMSDGRQQIVGLQFAPDFVGRPFEETSTVFARAATDVAVCQVSTKNFQKMTREFPGLDMRLHQQCMRALGDAQEWLLTLGRRTAREKVAVFIKSILEHTDPSQEISAGHTIELPLSQAEMADMLGLTAETVSRQIAALTKDGIIERIGGRTIAIRDPEKLFLQVGQ